MTTFVVEQEMIADNDSLIITDPCYLMAEEHWEHYCNLEFGPNPIGLDNYLRQYHNFGEVIAADTGFGDWSNTVRNSETGELLGEFTADAGMVICCTLSDLTNYGYDKDKLQDYINRGLATLIPNYSGHIELSYEENDCGRIAVLCAVSKDEVNEFNWNTEHLGE